MNVELRNISPEDATGVSVLSGQLGYTLTAEETEERIREIVLTESHCGFVAVHEKTIVGWIHAFRSIHVESKPFIEIGGLVVDENCREKGVGKMLVNRVREWCLQKGIQILRVRTNIKRTEARRFYEAIGFATDKEQKVYDMHL